MADSENTPLLTAAAPEALNSQLPQITRRGWPSFVTESLLCIVVAVLSLQVLISKVVDPLPPRSPNSFAIGFPPTILSITAVGGGCARLFISVRSGDQPVAESGDPTRNQNAVFVAWSTQADNAYLIRHTSVSYQMESPERAHIYIETPSPPRILSYSECPVTASVFLSFPPSGIPLDTLQIAGDAISLFYSGPNIRRLFNFTATKGSIEIPSVLSPSVFSAQADIGVLTFLGGAIGSDKILIRASAAMGLNAFNYTSLIAETPNKFLESELHPRLLSSTSTRIHAAEVEVVAHAFQGRFQVIGQIHRVQGEGIVVEKTGPLEGFVRRNTSDSQFLIDASTGWVNLLFWDN